MSHCIHCGETNPNNFYVINGYRQKQKCKDCHNKLLVEKWQSNKEKAVALKGGKCNHCGYDKYVGALEFHHLDPSVKEDAGSWNRKWMKKWETIERSIEDTVLLCANCHREEHHRLRVTAASTTG